MLNLTSFACRYVFKYTRVVLLTLVPTTTLSRSGYTEMPSKRRIIAARVPQTSRSSRRDRLGSLAGQSLLP